MAAQRGTREGMDDDGHGDEGEAGQRRRRRPPLAAHAAAEPGRRRAASCPAIAPVTVAGEGDGTHALADRSQQHVAPRDRGEHQVAGVAALQRDRTAVAPAAQPEGHGGDDDEAEHRRAAVDDVGELARRRPARR